jgi:serine/threonine protein kinase
VGIIDQGTIQKAPDHTLIDLQLPPHNCTVFCSTDANQVELIPKHVDENPLILLSLSFFAWSNRNHGTSSKSLTPFPQTPATELFPQNYTPYRISSACAMMTLNFVVGLVQLAHNWIAGLTYLHDHGNAYLDVKPGNILCTDDFCLQIIDVNAAVWVASEDQVVESVYGTQVAPEIREGAVFSPIRAVLRKKLL